MKTIYVLGSLNMDLAIETKALPRKGQTIVGEHFSTCAGGKGLNQAIAASKLGAPVKMLGAIGEDSFGEMMLKTLKENKVDVSHIRKLKDVSTGIAMIILNNKDNRIILDLGANLRLTREDVDSFLKDSKEGDIFVSQLENNIDAIGYALEVAKRKGMMTLINPAPSNKEILKYKQFIDVLVPNEGELHDLLRNRYIVELGIPVVIETKGKDGYSLYKDHNCMSNRAIRVDVVDTTGAGDAFVGALCYQLSLGKEINKESLDFASLAATLSTTRKGSSASSCTLEEINNYLK